MKWISIKDRKPTESGNQYHWRGKRCGGYSYFADDGNNLDTHGFELGDVAVNHTTEEYFEWLDESVHPTEKKLILRALYRDFLNLQSEEIPDNELSQSLRDKELKKLASMMKSFENA
jgi:hypothetical protein